MGKKKVKGGGGIKGKGGGKKDPPGKKHGGILSTRDNKQKHRNNSNDVGSNSRQSRKKSRNRESRTSDDYTFRMSLETDGRYTIREMDSDGNCLFRSLSDQLYWDHGSNHSQVRNDVCDYVTNHEEDFGVFLVLDDEDAKDDEDATDFKSYVNNMRDDGSWGGNIELVAASRLYRRNITVYQANQSALTITFDLPDSSSSSPGRSSNGNRKNNYQTQHNKPEANRQLPVLQLSYHDNGHYNSVCDNEQLPNKQNNLNKAQNGYQYNNSSSATNSSHYDPDYSDNDDCEEKEQYEVMIEDKCTATPCKSRNDSSTVMRTTIQHEITTSSSSLPQRYQNLNEQKEPEGEFSIIPSPSSTRNVRITTTKKGPCPCGSGKRYKKCCNVKEKTEARLQKLKRKGANATTSDNDGLQPHKETEISSNFRVLII